MRVPVTLGACLCVAKQRFHWGSLIPVCCAGSENNRCFVFEKSFGKPLLEHKFNTSRSLLV